MKAIVIGSLFLFILFSASSNAQLDSLFFEENFNFSGELRLNGWSPYGFSFLNPVTTTAGLTYPGYPSSGIGNAAGLDTIGQDVAHIFSSPSGSNNIYAGILVNVKEIAEVAFLHFSASLVPGSSEAGYLFLSTEDFNTFAFGLSKANTSPDGTTAAVYQKNVTYLLVMKYEVISGSGNDRVSLYVFSGTIPATEPGTPDLGPFSLGPDLSGQTPRVIVLRQDNLNQDITIDGIRLGTSWEVSPLPVELSSFTAALNNNKVILNWQTETEVNNYGFEVQKSESKNQQTEWQTIGFVEGYGNSNSPKSYSYTDNLTQNSAQTLRYRLKQID
ncbi:MAG: hypothetical protein HXY49_12890, partial [Ignavibacteriaceae bacterium]|nr:hypothetical protein [Ignavibacteriaceae bacterium]